MDRRELLQAVGGIGALNALAGTPLFSQGMASEGVAPSRAFTTSFENFREQFGPTEIPFDNPLPTDLVGTLYRNGPARMKRGDSNYHHWFDGDGMIQSFFIQGKTLRHSGKIVQTDKYKTEQKAGRFLWSGFGTSFDDALQPHKPDDINVANISVLPMGDEILALWEAGSAWRIDSKSLDTLGRKVFSAETNGLPFSAHPRVDSLGRIWNFGYLSGQNKIVLYELSPSGVLKRVQVVDSKKSNMIHDFAMTEQYLIFALMPIDFIPPTEPGIPSFLSMLKWDDNSSVDLLVIDKETLSVVTKIEIPPFFVFHFGNAWQEGSDLRIETARGPDFHALMNQIELATRGKALDAELPSHTAMDIIVDLVAGSVRTENLPFRGADFPCFDERFPGERTNLLVMLERSHSMPNEVFGYDTVSSFDRKSSEMASWSYGPTTIAEEHILVPKPNSKEGRGWILGTAYNWYLDQTEFRVFDTRSLKDGPIASASLPYGLPIGLHGKFVPGNA